MATALLQVGTGEEGQEFIPHLLLGHGDKPLSPAPAEGLVLWDTDCGVCWSPLAERERSCQFIDHLSRHYALMEKVCRVLKIP
jgi:tRNA pseudouridine38-40 synthase